jgi:hypothetical protein
MTELILLGGAMISTAATVFYLNKQRFVVLPARASRRKRRR